MYAYLQELPHPIGSDSNIAADGNGELNAVLLAEGVQPVQELLGLAIHIGTNRLAEVIDKHLRDIIVTGIEAADETAEHLIAVQIILLRVEQPDILRTVVGHIALRLNAHHIAGLILRRSVDEFNELLGLAGTLDAHNQSNHSRSLLSLFVTVKNSTGTFHAYSIP